MIPAHYRSLIETADDIRARRVSPVELLESTLDQVNRLNPRLYAYLSVMAETAREQAEHAGKEISGGHYRGPLHGVPVAVKDVCHTEHAPTSNGMPGRRTWRAGHDATVVQRLREAGAVLVGKLNMTEAASFHHHPDMPLPQNPWGADLWPGASSSGSGVATAAGLCFASLGSDTAGSIRVPSACNGLSGLKPTRGRVSRFGIAENVELFDTVGPMARTVADLAVVLAAVAGPDEHDPTALAEPVPDYLVDLTATESLDGLMIGVDQAFNALAPDGEQHAVLTAAVRTLEGLGAQVVEIAFPALHKEAVEQVGPIVVTATAQVHGGDFDAHPEMYSDALASAIGAGRGLPARVSLQARATCDAFARDFAATFRSVDLVLTPVLPCVAPTWAEFMELATTDSAGLLRFTAPANIAGLPALALPAGTTAAGHPVSMQLIGPHLAESRLLTAGHHFQQVTDWHLRHPDTDTAVP
ncbi:amidase [Streptomyces sp. NPDC047061]|uniref:amidase n=1 Tax=Streptomyces sp. NPDC047061 TaxID=3154605 RepID=UPI0033CFF387